MRAPRAGALASSAPGGRFGPIKKSASQRFSWSRSSTLSRRRSRVLSQTNPDYDESHAEPKY